MIMLVMMLVLQAYIGRPWGQRSRVVLVHSYLGEVVARNAWTDGPWFDTLSTRQTVFYAQVPSTPLPTRKTDLYAQVH